MRIVCQRVLQAKVEVDGQIVANIGSGMLVYLSVAKQDTLSDAQFIAEKIANMRIFADDQGKMNKTIREIGGHVLLVSNFTLHGDCRKGRRPGFDAAAEPQTAQKLYEQVVELVKAQDIPVQTGVFAARMKVAGTNDGPVTFLLDSTRLF